MLQPAKYTYSVRSRFTLSEHVFQVDSEIGEAIRESGVPRSEIFICSKFWNNFFHPDAVELCLDKILDNMQTDYLDLLLAHWPVAFKPTSLDGLKQARADGHLTKAEKGIDTRPDGGEIIDWTHTSEPIARSGGHPEAAFCPLGTP